MTIPTARKAPDTVPAEPAAHDGGPSEATGWRPSFSGAELAFLVIVPLAWAVLLAFHGTPDSDDIYGSLRDEATAFIVVHLGSIAFIALMGGALYLLLRGVPGRAAQIGRLAIVPFVALYAAADAIAGPATGILVKEANDGADTAAGAGPSSRPPWCCSPEGVRHETATCPPQCDAPRRAALIAAVSRARAARAP